MALVWQTFYFYVRVIYFAGVLHDYEYLFFRI